VDFETAVDIERAAGVTLLAACRSGTYQEALCSALSSSRGGSGPEYKIL